MKADNRPLCVLLTFFSVFSVCVVSPLRAEKPTGPREQFRALGVEERYFNRLSDGGPITQSERETLLRIMFRLRIFPLDDLHRWAMDSGLLETAGARPADYRGLIFNLRGRVVEVEPFRPPSEAAERYQLNKYYRCRLKLDEPPQTVTIYAENVPEQWREGAKPNASGGALGVFLKLAAGGAPVFVASRVAWYPNDLLGRLGMDVGLLDTVENRKRLTDKDRAAFYEMLAAVGRAKPGLLLRRAEDDLPKIPAKWRWTDREGQEFYSVAPLFNKPETQAGRLVALRGAARLVEKVYLGKDEADIVALYGFDHYYIISIFTSDSQGNPLTVCVRELPEGMPVGGPPDYGESVLAAGFFFKVWGYDVSTRADENVPPDGPKTRLQLSPLLIGRSLVWRPPSKPADQTRANIIVAGLFIAAMLVVWYVAWLSMRRERRWIDQAIGGPPKDFSPPKED